MIYPVGARVQFKGLSADKAREYARLYHSLRGRDPDLLGITLVWTGCHCPSLFVVERVDTVSDHYLRCEE